MKIFTSFVLVLLCGLFSGNSGGSNPKPAEGSSNSPDPQAGRAAKPVSLQCNRDLLWSYKLKGRPKASTTEQFILCPAVKNSCCNKIDQQKIYHIVNDILPVRHLTYRSKIEQAISRLRRLHEKIRKAIFEFPGTMQRRKWCVAQQRKVINYPFKKFFRDLSSAIEYSAHDNLKHYESFYCVLCDAKNHQFVTMDKEVTKITLDLGYCRTFLDKRKREIQLLNVQLIEYMQMIQGVVDCVHYTKSYNLNFFDAARKVFAQQVDSCLRSVSGSGFGKDCKPLCDQMSISDIIPVAEGDSVFLTNAVSLFEKFFEYQEKGKLVSMKLRLFFKRFEIPKTMTSVRRAQFLSNIDQKIATPAMKNAKLIKPPSRARNPKSKKKRKSGRLASPSPIKSNSSSPFKLKSPSPIQLNDRPEASEDSPYNPMNDIELPDPPITDDENYDQNQNQNRNQNQNLNQNQKIRTVQGNPTSFNNLNPKSLAKIAARELSMTDSFNPEIESLLYGNFGQSFEPQSQSVADFEAGDSFPVAEDDSLSRNSIDRSYQSMAFQLGEGRKLSAVQNSLAQQPNSIKTGNNQSTNSTASSFKLLKRKRTASLVFDKDLFRFYDEIAVRKVGKDQNTIYKIRAKPIDLTKAEKVFAADNGINPELYNQNRFNMPKSLFYKELFTFRESDKRDPNLLYMLADFNKDYKNAANLAIKTQYKIKPEDYKFKFTRKVNAKKPAPEEKPLITWDSLQSKPGPSTDAGPSVPGNSSADSKPTATPTSNQTSKRRRK